MADAVSGHELLASMEGFTPYFAIEPTATYSSVEFEHPGTPFVIARHYASISHILTDEAHDWVAAVGRGVGNPRHPQYAVFLSVEQPPQAQIYERIDP